MSAARNSGSLRPISARNAEWHFCVPQHAGGGCCWLRAPAQAGGAGGRRGCAGTGFGLPATGSHRAVRVVITAEPVPYR